MKRLFANQNFGYQNVSSVYFVDIGGRRLIDTHISEQAETILAHRYFVKDTNGEPIENTTELFWRVGKPISEVDHQYEVFPS